MSARPGFAPASADELASFLARHPEVVELDAVVTNLNGALLGKRVPIAEAAKIFKAGVQFSASAPLSDVRGMGHDALGIGQSDGDPDAAGLPVAGTLTLAPWTATPTAQVLCAQTGADGEPLWFDPRRILADVVDRCRADGLHPVVALEPEFYLLDPERDALGRVQPARAPLTGQRPGTPRNLSVATVEEFGTILSALDTAAKVQDLPLICVTAEYGLAQFEANLGHGGDPLLAADQAMMLRRMVQGVAAAHGLSATFMARPFVDQPGNGLHVHVSLVDEEGNNRFGADPALLGHAIGGMQALMYDSMALFAPNLNAWRRYDAPFVPQAPLWGENNRSVAFRVPLSPPSGRRIEHRVAGADASPHLVLAAILAAIHHGVIARLDPGKPVVGRSTVGRGADFPSGLLPALDRLERAEALATYIPAPFLQAYAHVKRGEFDSLLAPILDGEYAFYL